ncbi:C-type lectin domain family 4 member M-like [Xiphophorus maculatus]|uniref:C-type lectin domain family 4 member M-like n=1 Tax=Xiphophorus maculatus TaxID=8083 RepID=UPI000C6CD752|nr:C-type lectin domain family 4 member M-like [Xiphophorus maculatus]
MHVMTAKQQESIKNLTTERRQLIEERKMKENQIEEVIRDRHLSAVRAGLNPQRLTQEREELNKEREELRKKIDELSLEKEELSKKIDDLNNEKDELNKEKDELSKKTAELSSKTEELNKEKAELSKNTKDLNKKKLELNKEKDKLSEDKKEQSQEKEKLNKEKDELSKDKKELSNEKEKLNKEKDELSKEKKYLSTEKEELKKDKAELNKEREKLRVLTDEAENRCKNRDALKNFYDALMKFDNFPVHDLCPVWLRPKCHHCTKHEKSYKGHCYYIYPYDIGYANWDRSRQLCKIEGGDLVVIDDLEEQEFINNHTKQYDSDNHGYWIGLRHFRRNWSWVDGRRNFLEFWIKGIPHSSGAALHMPRKKATESWKAEDKLEAYKFICERLEISWPFS